MCHQPIQINVDEAGGQAQMVDAFSMFMFQPNSHPHVNKTEFSGQANKTDPEQITKEPGQRGANFAACPASTLRRNCCFGTFINISWCERVSPLCRPAVWWENKASSTATLKAERGRGKRGRAGSHNSSLRNVGGIRRTGS